MERSSFFNAILDSKGTPDRSYLAEDFAIYFSTFIGNGVFPNPSNQCQVVAVDTNMQIRIKAGYAWINGYMYQNTDDYIFKLEPADGVLNRIDRISLRLDFLERKIKAVVKKGAYAGTAVVPTLQRDADAYEIALADIAINKGIISVSQANITDLRLNKDLCGIVHGTVDQVDTTAIFNQFQSWYSTTKENYDKDIATWTKEKKQAFDKWYNTNIQAFMDKFNRWYGDNTTQWTNDFNIWFESIKGQLNGDIAAKLTAKTIELENSIKALNGVKVNKTDFESQMADTMKLGKANTDVNLVKSVEHKIDTRSTSLIYNTSGVLTRVEEKDGSTIVKTTVLNYNSDGSLRNVVVTAGGKTVTTTLNMSGEVLSNITKVVV